jgi:hypothetical protein
MQWMPYNTHGSRCNLYHLNLTRFRRTKRAMSWTAESFMTARLLYLQLPRVEPWVLGLMSTVLLQASIVTSLMVTAVTV